MADWEEQAIRPARKSQRENAEPVSGVPRRLHPCECIQTKLFDKVRVAQHTHPKIHVQNDATDLRCDEELNRKRILSRNLSDDCENKSTRCSSGPMSQLLGTITKPLQLLDVFLPTTGIPHWIVGDRRGPVGWNPTVLDPTARTRADPVQRLKVRESV